MLWERKALGFSTKAFDRVGFAEGSGEFQGINPFFIGGESSALAGTLFLEARDFFVGFERTVFAGKAQVAGGLHGGLPDVVAGAPEREGKGFATVGEFPVGAEFYHGGGRCGALTKVDGQNG